MEFRHYLAMTPQELAVFPAPRHLAWMACHFSPEGDGLCDLPEQLPPGSLLILNDRLPVGNHTPERILPVLADCAAKLGCSGLLLDLERPWNEKTAGLVRRLCEALPCPVAVSEQYANGLDCAVFLSPIPPDASVKDILHRWQGRETWLETALVGQCMRLTPLGCRREPLPAPVIPAEGFPEDRLHCHYQIETAEDAAVFTLWRTREDLDALLAEARSLGVTAAVGLYQELGIRNS